MSILRDYVADFQDQFKRSVDEQMRRVPAVHLKAFAALMQYNQLYVSLATPQVNSEGRSFLDAEWKVYQQLREDLASELERRQDETKEG